MLLKKYYSITILNIALLYLINNSALSEAKVRKKREAISSLKDDTERFNITRLLYQRFGHLFVESNGIETGSNNSSSSNDQLEMRKVDQVDGQKQGNNLQFSSEDESQNKRNYFKVLNKVFSRIELPDIYKTTTRSRAGLHCATHIGCVEEIPNFPSLLKKPNVSSSFTVYTGENPKLGHKIVFEPTMHYQLQDSATSEIELQDKLKPEKLRQTAMSWRSAANIIHTQEYPFDFASLEQSGFNSSLNTRIIVGGYFAKEDEEWIDEVVKQWLLLEPSNIIKVSWADSNRGLYHTAAYNSRIVGRQLTLFLYYLDQMFHIDLNRFHIVGHSLGAHIAGFVGSDNDGKVARITGLDPAGPIFVELNTSLRLDPGDAKFVDVVHTNGGSITKGALGMSIPSGHVDYYCNGGSVQPGCYFSSVTKSIMDPVERVACNHRRSYRYFIEIIKLTIGEKHLLGLETIDQGVTDETTSVKRESDPISSRSLSVQSESQLPHAFLFSAKNDDLIRLMQPEIVLKANSLRRDIDRSEELAPLKRRLEFHLLNPDFPNGKRGMYFFRTRSESPFFATKQYALTLRTDNVVRRKIAIVAKIDHTVVAETELDEIPGAYTLTFALNDPRIVDLSETNRIPQLSLMWKYRSFNLLLNQQSELHLTSVELSLLDTDKDQPTIRYGANQRSSSTGDFFKSSHVGHLVLSRNHWYKFDGRLARVV